MDKVINGSLQLGNFTVYFRIALAALHFNENLRRKKAVGKNGEIYKKVCYPKFKLGEETVREISRPPTYGK